MMRIMRLVIVLGAVGLCNAGRAQAAPDWKPGLSDRELAIQRWFSYLTFLSDRKATPWPEWFDDGKQFDVSAFRYQLAFCGYGCTAMAAKTPAYREVIQRQLRDICERIIDVRVWHYVTHYWQYGDAPPDPCLYENVMYTGHLTQLMCLYELMTGDMRYSKQGWDFVWRDGRKIHYTLDKAIRRLHTQSVANRPGGVCCEPGMSFADCNSPSSVSYLIHDLLHGTEYAKVNAKWFDWMSKKFRNRMPGATTFLYVVYKAKEDLFMPVGDCGADGWALGWGHPWYPDETFCRQGWEYLLKNGKWTSPTPDQMYAEINPLIACCAKPTPGAANSFLALTGVQAEGAEGPTVKKIINWMDAQFGRPVDTDGDGHKESYCYHTCNAFRIPVTGNMAAALATDGDSMRKLYRTPRDKILSAPTLARVDYPNVLVRSAEYIAPTLRFTVLKGKPDFKGKTELVCKGIPTGATVRRDGTSYANVERKGATLTIRTDVDSERIFEITEER